MLSQSQELIDLTNQLAEQDLIALNSTTEKLRALDENLRKHTWDLEQEERAFDLPSFASPKLTYFNYLFQGWSRSLIEPSVLRQFLMDYGKSISTTLKEIEKTSSQVSKKESSAETQAIEEATALITKLSASVNSLLQIISDGPHACEALVQEILKTGNGLAIAFEKLENCTPLSEPCPFCGGVLLLSGRCRSCSRRIPHLKEDLPDEEQPLDSDFLSNNCRALDLAVMRWQTEPSSEKLWNELREQVLKFSACVTTGNKQREFLSASPDRPIDSQQASRVMESTLNEIGLEFQGTLTILAEFTRQNFPPSKELSKTWREPLLKAESRLQEIENQLSASLEEESTGDSV